MEIKHAIKRLVCSGVAWSCQFSRCDISCISVSCHEADLLSIFLYMCNCYTMLTPFSTTEPNLRWADLLLWALDLSLRYRWKSTFSTVYIVVFDLEVLIAVCYSAIYLLVFAVLPPCFAASLFMFLFYHTSWNYQKSAPKGAGIAVIRSFWPEERLVLLAFLYQT